MADLEEGSVWEDGIYQLETDDPVMGGAEGIDNLQAKQLASRTQYLLAQLLLRAPLASPTFTGDPKAPTPAAADNDTSIATTAFVKTAIANLVASSPAALDTLNELAAALGNDANFSATMTAALAAKSPLASPTFTGDPKAPTPAPGDNDTSIATTAFVVTAIAAKQSSSLQGAFRNLKGSATGTNAVVTYTADEVITSDGASEYLTTRNWNSTITMTSAGAGGLDTGAVAASTWYNAFAITKDDGTKALIASLSSTTPTLPVGYTKWARIGAFRTDGTANKYPLSLSQSNRTARYKLATGSNVTTFPQMTSNAQGSLSTPTWVAVGVANFVPPTAIEIAVVAAATNNGAAIALVPNNNYGGVTTGGGNVANRPQILAVSDAGGVSGHSSGSMLLEGSNIYVATSATNNTQSNCLGWTDNL